MLKIILFFNWVVVAILAILVVAETIQPRRNGGDAAGRGIGQAIYYLAIIALVVLLILNLLPYDLPKYIAFGLIVVPLLWFRSFPVVSKLYSRLKSIIKPQRLYEDPDQNRLAWAIFKTDTDKLRRLIESLAGRLKDPEYGYPLYQNAVDWAMRFTTPANPARYECIRMLLDAGIATTSPYPDHAPLHVGAASSGNPEMLKFLLDLGADPNARGYDYGTGKPHQVPILFEAMETAYGARNCMRLLLDYGADPNAVKPLDGDFKGTSALMWAAHRGRYDLCLMLLEKGADPRYVSPDKRSLHSIMEIKKAFVDGQYSSKEEMERVKAVI